MPAEQSVDALAFLEDLTGGPLTFASNLRAIRQGEELSLAEFAKLLGVSRQHLHDVEHGRKAVSVERAAAWAKLLGYSEKQFVRLALQAELERAGLDYKVTL